MDNKKTADFITAGLFSVDFDKPSYSLDLRNQIEKALDDKDAEIAELERIIIEQGKTLNLYNTGAIKQDAIREMYDVLAETFPFQLHNKHRYFIKEYAKNLEKDDV